MQTTLTATTEDGTKVVGWLHQVKSNTVVLVIHGHLARCDRPRFIELAKAISNRGYACCRMNITRKLVGENIFDVPTPTQEAAQAAAMARLLVQKYKRVITCGHSQGWMSALKLVHDGFAEAGVCMMGVMDIEMNQKGKLEHLGMTFAQLQADGYALRDYDNRRFSYTPEFFQDFQSWNIIGMIQQVHKPLLFIFGNKDTSIPPQEVMKGYEAANQPKELFAVDCNHGFDPKYSILIAEKITSWIKEFS